jgi:Nanos RNA binding domain
LKKVFENRKMHKPKTNQLLKMSRPNCKVCRDAGKTEQEYSSHWVRDKAGRVTCPTLLSQKCRNCGKSGHTIKYCKVNKLTVKPSTEKKELKKEIQIQNRYHALLEDDEPESPVVFATLPQVATPQKTSYLDILEKKTTIVDLKDLKKSTLNLAPNKVKRSWASEVSSETTEEDNFLILVQM